MACTRRRVRAASGLGLWYAMRSIPIGTAYAVWTSIGALGSFIVGVKFLGQPSTFVQWASIAGVVGLKLGAPAHPS